MNEPEDRALEPSQLEQEAAGWVLRFTSGDASRADLDALARWSAISPAHRRAFDEVSRTWQVLGSAERAGSPTLAAFQNRHGTHVAPRIDRRAVLGGAFAASAAGAVYLAVRPPFDLWWSWSERTADYRTDTGERRQIALSEGVLVEMNTQTSIALRPAGGESGRIELIRGEAIISASPGADSPVTIMARDGRIVATDARFNVRHDLGSVCVTCLQGKLQVERMTTTLPLSAGRQVVYSEKGIGVAVPVDASAVTAWQDGVVIFDGTPIVDVIAEINRYRRGKVVLLNAALGRERFNARFRIENIDRVVGQIEQVFGARATKLPGNIILLG
jgi:transmembrane sensor